MPKRPDKLTKWTLTRAAKEFGCDRNTLSKRLASVAASADEQGLFTTKQISAALHGDISGARLRKVLAEAQLAEHALAELERTKIPLVEVTFYLNNVCTCIRETILNSDLDMATKRRCIEELRQLSEHDFSKEPEEIIPA